MVTYGDSTYGTGLYGGTTAPPSGYIHTRLPDEGVGVEVVASGTPLTEITYSGVET